MTNDIMKYVRLGALALSAIVTIVMECCGMKCTAWALI